MELTWLRSAGNSWRFVISWTSAAGVYSSRRRFGKTPAAAIPHSDGEPGAQIALPGVEPVVGLNEVRSESICVFLTLLW